MNLISKIERLANLSFRTINDPALATEGVIRDTMIKPLNEEALRKRRLALYASLNKSKDMSTSTRVRSKG